MAGGANPQQVQQPNVYNQSAGAYNAALGGTAQAAAGPNIGQFMNPYTSMVTGNTLQDLERQRQMATNTTGAQASAAGAFGGSRHGIADAATNEAFARTGAQTFGNLQQQGFNTALGAAQNQQNIGLQAAGQMGNLANLGFGFGNQIGQQQATQGGQQQNLQQQLINAARQQFAGYTGAGAQSLQLPLQALGATQYGQSTTQTSQPGLFDYLTLGANAASNASSNAASAAAMGGSDVRLKENITPTHKVGDVQFYVWTWSAEGRRIVGDQDAKGVMANELYQTHPHLVGRGEDGYLRVDYDGLAKELRP